ncbi:MAG: VWA domain-containing protein [Kiritimatiellae bacterium]|nr:VWA domain-containing protein [Kiritimatiellia bacterium]
MKRGFRTDLLIFSLIVSAVLHVAVMFYAKPRIMTHVAFGGAHVPRKGPMRVTEAVKRPEPVRIDTLKDVAAEKDAPEAETTVEAVPSVEDAPPDAPGAGLETPEVPMPDPGAAETPIVPIAEVVTAPLSPAPRPEPRMVSDALPQPAPSAPIAPPPSMSDALVPAAPAFQAPPLALAGVSPEPDSAAVAKEFRKDSSGPEFAPPPEVMDAVDEKVVEKEKAAVRRLVDVPDALDLAKAVDIRLNKASGPGVTYFSLTVSPKSNLSPVPKDVVVLIDASGSIGKDRMGSIRRAAKKILRSASNTGDRFNLVAFRDRFSYAFRSWQECNVQSFDAADRWLNNVAPFGRTDVFATIASVLTLPRSPSRPLIALVVTDGDANSGVSRTADILSKFTRLNDGLVSVYMYGVKSSANRELIDVLTRGNRGESFIFEQGGLLARTRAGEGIEGLSMRFRDPVLSDLRLVFASGCDAEAYPRLLKNLYRGGTVQIVGRVPSGTKEIAFSLKGLNGRVAYEGFFRLPLASASTDPMLPVAWRDEREIDGKLR